MAATPWYVDAGTLPSSPGRSGVAPPPGSAIASASENLASTWRLTQRRALSPAVSRRKKGAIETADQMNIL